MRYLFAGKLFPAFALVVLPAPALAIPAISCHCFTERSYEPARPAAADPYFLATVQNSFFALVFNVDKKSIVLRKQQGASSDDMWIAYWIASKSGTSPDALLQAKKGRETWKDALAQLQPGSINMGARFTSALNAKSSGAILAEKVVDELFLRHQLLTDADLAGMRKAGASNQELIIATVIAAKTGQAARPVLLETRNGSKSWGSLLKAARIDTKNMLPEISAILKIPPR